MLQNDKELRSLVYRIRKDRRISSNIVAEIDEYLVSTDKKILKANNLYELIQGFDFSQLYRNNNVEEEKENIEHCIETDVVRIFFSNIKVYDSLTTTLLEGFFSDLVIVVNYSCALMNSFFRFSGEEKNAPYLHNIKDILIKRFPDHDLTKLVREEYSKNPKTWMASLIEIRNDIHHKSTSIGEFEFTDVSRSEVSFFLYEKYFSSFPSREEREIKYFCGHVLEKMELFLSQMYEIFLKELEAKGYIPFCSSTRI